MKRFNHIGFTIIETMLFLGITGLLVMGVMVGFGSSINVQRYRDSVTSLQSILQQQFSDASNVVVNNATNVCNAVNVPRGQSNCVVLGRYITTADGVNFTSKSVIGSDTSTNFSDDLSVLKQYNIKVSQSSNNNYEMSWGTSLVRPLTNNTASFSMLILRSPISGTIRTFIDSNASVAENSIQTLLTLAAQNQAMKVCVAPNGLSSSTKSAVIITANASSASNVETLGEATSGC